MNREVLYAENLVTLQARGHDLEGISFFLNEGEILGIVGLNGSGVATLAGVLSGRTPLHTGRLYFHGTELIDVSRERFELKGIYEIGSDLPVVVQMSVSENLNVLRRSRSCLIHRKADRERTREILERYSIGGTPDLPAASLSRRQSLQLAMCRAILDGAELLVCNNIGYSFSEEENEIFCAFLRQLRDEGYSIILTETNAGQILRYSDRVIVMRNGMACLERCVADVSWDTVLKCLDMPHEGKSEYLPHRMRYNTPLQFRSFRADFGFVSELDVEPGHTYGLIWSNRQAEDAFARLFNGMSSVQGVVIDGNRRRSFGRWYRANHIYIRQLNMYFWEKDVFENMTVGENIALWSYHRFDSRAGVLNKRILRLAQVEFAQTHGVPLELLDAYPRHVPVSIRQRISLWRALFAPPRILVLTNPLYAADELLRRLLWEALAELKGFGCAILWSGIDEMTMCRYFCDSIIYMNC